MPLTKKTKAIFKLMERFLTQKEISNTDASLLDEFKCSYRTLERYLKEIEDNYYHIITIKQDRKKVWKLVRVSDIFEEFVNNSYDLVNLFDLAQGFDPQIFKELEKGTLSKIAKNDETVFLFKNLMMEEMKSEKTKMIFENLKIAVKNKEYRDIVYTYDTTTLEKDVKCIKLIFMNNNWYLAIVNLAGELKFRRLNFIDEIRYSSKSNYQLHEVKSYLEFLGNLQNAMSLYGVKVKKAIIRATPNIAKYFEPKMKKLLSSQKFISKEKDGSIIFSLEYTQELEILPLIQKWLPDLIILEPQELKEAYRKKLEKALKNLQ